MMNNWENVYEGVLEKRRHCVIITECYKIFKKKVLKLSENQMSQKSGGIVSPLGLYSWADSRVLFEVSDHFLGHDGIINSERLDLLWTICLLGRNRVTSSGLGWRFVEHFIVRIYMLKDPEMLSSPVSGKRVVLDSGWG